MSQSKIFGAALVGLCCASLCGCVNYTEYEYEKSEAEDYYMGQNIKADVYVEFISDNVIEGTVEYDDHVLKLKASNFDYQNGVYVVKTGKLYVDDESAGTFSQSVDGTYAYNIPDDDISSIWEEFGEYVSEDDASDDYIYEGIRAIAGYVTSDYRDAVARSGSVSGSTLFLYIWATVFCLLMLGGLGSVFH